MVITIDGLSATGKSSVAIKLAHTLHYTYFNTGLVYRMITYLILKEKLEDISQILDVLNHLDFKLVEDKVLISGMDITNFLYTDEISLATSKYFVIPEIKEWVRDIQQEYIHKGNIIMEGRDIGTRIAPHADIKFYLYASLEERARRLIARGSNESLSTAIKRLEAIDLENKESKDFIEPNDAIKINTTHMSFDEVYDSMLQIINECSTS